MNLRGASVVSMCIIFVRGTVMVVVRTARVFFCCCCFFSRGGGRD